MWRFLFYHYIEKCGGVSDRCELNRQIKADNILLRKLKELVHSLENTAVKIAEKLENIRNNLITLKYKFIFNKKQIKQVEIEKQLTPNLIKQFRDLLAEIDQKTAEHKKLKAEKNACSPLNIFRQNQLSKQLDALTEEIQKIKSDKKFVLYELGCKSGNDVDIVEQNYKYNLDTAEKLKARNADLQTEYKTEKANYIEIKNNILPENISAVQEERTAIQADGIRQTRKELENIYKGNFDDDIFSKAQKSVNDELGEMALRKSLIQQMQQAQQKQKSVDNKCKNYEIER